MLNSLFQHIPLYGVLIITFVLLVIAFETGIFFGRKYRTLEKNEEKAPISSLVGATLGLLALLIAFTFSISATKFEQRRMMVVEEANAIGTTSLRAEYLPEPQRSTIKGLLKDYVALRVKPISAEELDEKIRQSELIQDKLWTEAVAVAKGTPDSIVAGLFIQSLNEVIDLQTKRVNIGAHYRMPVVIWNILYFVSILAFGAVGYQIGLFHARYTGIILLLILTFSAVIALIVDLDRPQEGLIQVSLRSLIDLMNKFNH